MVAYCSTRGEAGIRSFEEVLLAGLAEDGGLFLPTELPVLSDVDWAALEGAGYAETAKRVLTPFLGGALDADAFGRIVDEAYASFAHPAVAPLVQLGPNDWLLELFHGPTLAFKDFALQLLGRVFETVLTRRNERVTIVGATSGDTGSAALAATAGRANMRIVILHPKGRVSAVQRRQMTTVVADNVLNVAVEGTFDDCQEIVKQLFMDEAFRKEQRLAAINSINWLRVAAQAVYYIYAAMRLGGRAKSYRFVVPTGNFGDVYAGHLARGLGLPVEKLVVATNGNDILARFFQTGVYAKGRVMPTTSPSMDIQVASNFERLLFELLDRDPAKVRAAMADFALKGRLEVTPECLERANALFVGQKIEESEVAATIAGIFRTTGLVLDPHSAVAVAAARDLRTDPHLTTIALATAHPAKFPDAVEAAIGHRPALPAALADLFDREESYASAPADPFAIQDLIRETA